MIIGGAWDLLWATDFEFNEFELLFEEVLVGRREGVKVVPKEEREEGT